jgi:hypothetical protein
MTTFTKTAFGDMLELNAPEEFDLALICIDTIAGHQPVKLRLSHQIYRDDLKKLLARNSDVRSITIIPIKSTDKISRLTITKDDL